MVMMFLCQVEIDRKRESERRKSIERGALPFFSFLTSRRSISNSEKRRSRPGARFSLSLAFKLVFVCVNFLQSFSLLCSFDHRQPPLRRGPPGRRLERRRRGVALAGVAAVFVVLCLLLLFLLLLLLLLLLDGQPGERVPIQPGPVRDRRQARECDAGTVDLSFECFWKVEEVEVEVEKDRESVWSQEASLALHSLETF